MSEKNQYPSLGQQAKNLAQFSWELIQYIHNSKGGPLMVSDEIYKERTTICKSCIKFDDLENKCMECGCFVPAKAKMILDSCPLNKWKDLSGEWREVFNQIMKDTEENKNEST